VGAKDGFAIGYKFKSEGGEIAEEYLVARPGTHYLWENGDQAPCPLRRTGLGATLSSVRRTPQSRPIKSLGDCPSNSALTSHMSKTRGLRLSNR
jgi:hypothetical protein